MNFLEMECTIYVTLRNTDNFKCKEFEFKCIQDLKDYMDSGYYLMQDIMINGMHWHEGEFRKLVKTFK